MCGRYYIDDGMSQEMLKIITAIEKKRGEGRIRRGEIYPGSEAPVLVRVQNEITAEPAVWGFMGFDKKSVIINARAETALEKKMFREGVLSRRCLVPASGFCEWNRQKEKIYYVRPDGGILYMAGICGRDMDSRRFVILTTGANRSIEEVHDRMPVVLDERDAGLWMEDEEAVRELLVKTPPLLEQKAAYRQITLDFRQGD